MRRRKRAFNVKNMIRAITQDRSIGSQQSRGRKIFSLHICFQKSMIYRLIILP